MEHEDLGRYLWEAGISSTGVEPQLIFTHNDTNMERIFGSANPRPFVKDAFHERVVGGHFDAVNPANEHKSKPATKIERFISLLTSLFKSIGTTGLTRVCTLR